MKIKLSNYGIYLITLLIGAAIYNFIELPVSVPEAVYKTYRFRLANEYNRKFPQIQITPEDITFSKPQIKGIWSTRLAKVSISVNGKIPPDKIEKRVFEYKQPLFIGVPYFWNEVSEFYFKANLLALN